MQRDGFSGIETWVFDLDNTLYPPEARLFDLIEVRMTAYVMRALGLSQPEADRLRAEYWRRHGTTLAGLMREHDLDPMPYLKDVHDIPLDALSPAPALRRAIAALPGRRIVYTNACEPYALRVLEALGLSGLFDAVYGVEHADYHPKPDAAAFHTVFTLDGLQPDRAVMFEDDSRNLAVPHAMGLVTVHVAEAPDAAPHVHHHTSDLTGFLSRLAG